MGHQGSERYLNIQSSADITRIKTARKSVERDRSLDPAKMRDLAWIPAAKCKFEALRDRGNSAIMLISNQTALKLPGHLSANMYIQVLVVDTNEQEQLLF